MARIYLPEIIETKKQRLLERKFNQAELEVIADQVQVTKSFLEALAKPGLSIIGEIKKASPSKGLIKEDFQPLLLAKEYEMSVDAISVLTEETYFQGSDAYLKEVSAAVTLPTLCKDFIFTKEQILNAKILGASAVLLIVAILSDIELKELYDFASSIGLDVLVEVHTEEETLRALRINPNIIGINNRDLETFVTNIETTIKLRGLIPSHIRVVSESGIFLAEDITFLQQTRFDAVLVGESFMRSSDMLGLAKQLKEAYHYKPEIKVCGIKTVEELELLKMYDIHYFGMIFVEKSKRNVSLTEAKLLSANRGTLKVVGVFQNASIETVKEYCVLLHLDYVQLHGRESQEYINQLTVPVWKVIPVENESDLHFQDEYHHVSGFLYDTKVKEVTGGTGQVFSWEFLKDHPRKQLRILAGGLGPNNVQKAIREVHPDVLDFNSKLEVDGIKTKEKLDELFNQLKEDPNA